MGNCRQWPVAFGRREPESCRINDAEVPFLCVKGRCWLIGSFISARGHQGWWDWRVESVPGVQLCSSWV